MNALRSSSTSSMPLSPATSKARRPRRAVSEPRIEKPAPSSERPVAARSADGRLLAVARRLSSRGPAASMVWISITPPGPPTPSIGEAGDIDTRIWAMSVTGIEEMS